MDYPSRDCQRRCSRGVRAAPWIDLRRRLRVTPRARARVRRCSAPARGPRRPAVASVRRARTSCANTTTTSLRIRFAETNTPHQRMCPALIGSGRESGASTRTRERHAAWFSRVGVAVSLRIRAAKCLHDLASTQNRVAATPRSRSGRGVLPRKIHDSVWHWGCDLIFYFEFRGKSAKLPDTLRPLLRPQRLRPRPRFRTGSPSGSPPPRTGRGCCYGGRTGSNRPSKVACETLCALLRS